MSVCLCISAFLAIYLQYSTRMLTKTNLELADQLDSSRMRFEALLIEQSTMTSRSRLESLAEKSLMVLPKANNMVIYKDIINK